MNARYASSSIVHESASSHDFGVFATHDWLVYAVEFYDPLSKVYDDDLLMAVVLCARA